tara:strand:- start:780 stop:1391 length:612 start_codon:yes stop_codon:yes gene_type:complete
MNPWKIENVTERFQQLCCEGGSGISFSTIAETLNSEFPGVQLSRNGCIGKAHRLGLSKPIAQSDSPRSVRIRKISAGRAVAPLRDRRAAKKALTGQGWGKRLPAALPAAETPPILVDGCFDPLPSGFGVRLDDAAADQCRWPHGDPMDKNFRFCGAEVAGEAGARKSYCADHAQLVYASPRYMAVSNRILRSNTKAVLSGRAA